MKTERIVKMDPLGRILIPKIMRKQYGWTDEGNIFSVALPTGLLLSSTPCGCILCGAEKELHEISGFPFCRECLDKMNREAQKIE